MSNDPLTKIPEWERLTKHHADMQGRSIYALFERNPQRFDQFSADHNGVLLDYSKNLVTEDTMAHLMALARRCDIEERRDAMFSGAPINTSENRAVLHTALRGSNDDTLEIDGENISAFVGRSLDAVKEISTKIRAENKFTDVVNIGIGGSDLGAHMVYEALRPFADGPRVHFVSNVDGAHIVQTLKDLSPETTLFIVASKTFTTLETMTNAHTAKAWISKTLGESAIAEHFIAVTCNAEDAREFGVRTDNILPLREWIGGRYSLWSAIGVSTAIAYGFENFKALLDGARVMDTHFKSAPLEQNLPVIMAMIGIWHRNFCKYDTLAILPYARNLHRLPKYVQQLDMESNGKSVDRDGQDVDYQTSPVVFGEPGTDGQHAFFQLLHQGTVTVPCDFIMIANSEHDLDNHHKHLLANALAQSEALMKGQDATGERHKTFGGNRPSSSILLDRLDPYHLGMVLALYEHKTFVQGAVWRINSFDQWGVELGKKIAKTISQAFDKEEKKEDLPSATRPLLHYILKKQNSKNS